MLRFSTRRILIHYRKVEDNFLPKYAMFVDNYFQNTRYCNWHVFKDENSLVQEDIYASFYGSAVDFNQHKSD